MVSNAKWNGKNIDYRPGVIFIYSNLFTPSDRERSVLVKCISECEGVYLHKQYRIGSSTIFEVRVPKDQTVYMAEQIKSWNYFRKVDLDILERRS